MADYEVPVVSDGNHVVDMFNAVKMMTQLTDGTTSGQFNSIMATVGLVGLIIVLINVLLRNNFAAMFQWVIAYTLVWGVLFIPKVNVIVVDHTDPTVETSPVENVPLGIGMLAWITTSFGDRVATSMETIMAPVDSVSYNGGNMLWGQKVMSEMPGMEYTSARVSNNMNLYLRNCVFPTVAADPTKMQAMKTSPDLWAHLASNPPTSRMTEFTTGAGVNSFLSCQAAALLMGPDLTQEGSDALTFYGQRLYPDKDGTDANTALKDDMTSMHSTFLGVSRDGAEMLKQIMMINQFERGLQGYATDSASASLMNFVESRAETQSRLTMSGLGAIMQTAMPRLYVLLFILLIAIFPFIVAMGLIPGVGFTVVKNYAYGFIYLQAFPVLFIIINRIIVVENQELATAAAKSAGGAGINLENIGILSQIPSQTAAMAGVMLTLVPVLAGIFTKGVGTLAGQMDSVLRPMHVATESAAQEAASGNVSVGNTSVNTSNMDNATQGQVNKSPMLDVTRSGRRLTNGALAYQNADGSMTVNSQDARSNIMTRPDFRSSALEQISQSRSIAERQEENATASYTKAQEQSRAQTAGLVFATGMGEDVSKSVGLTNNRDVNKSVEAARSDMNRFATDNNVSFQDLARAYASAEMVAEGGLKVFGNGVTAKGTVGGEGSVQAQRASNLVKGKEFQDMMRQSESLNSVEQAMSGLSSNERFTQSNDFTEGYNNSLNKTESAQETVSQASAKVDSLDAMKSRVESNDSSLSSDLSQIQFGHMRENLGDSEAVRAAAATSNDSFSLEQQRVAGNQAVATYIGGIMGGNLVAPNDVSGQGRSQTPPKADFASVSEGYGDKNSSMRASASQRPTGEGSASAVAWKDDMSAGRDKVYAASIQGSNPVEGDRPNVTLNPDGTSSNPITPSDVKARETSDAVFIKPWAEKAVDLVTEDPTERKEKVSNPNNGAASRAENWNSLAFSGGY